MYIVFVQAETRFLDIPYHRGRVGLNHLAFHATSQQQVDEVARKVKGQRSYNPLCRQASFCRREESLCCIFRRSRSDEGRTRGPLTIVGIAITIISIFPILRFGLWAK